MLLIITRVHATLHHTLSVGRCGDVEDVISKLVMKLQLPQHFDGERNEWRAPLTDKKED